MAACDLLQGLLHKDQKQRLGSKEDFVGDQELGWDCLLLPSKTQSC